MGLKCFILHYTRLFLCVCTIGENTSLRYFFFLVSTTLLINKVLFILKKSAKKENPKKSARKNELFLLFLILLFESFHNMSVAFKTVAWFTV